MAQAKARVRVNGLQDPERALAGVVNDALDRFENAIAPARPTPEGKAAKTTAE